ncbi:histone-fold-containing protein [Fomitiporia mediterranea MF3/22]|uniref:histone-fold-containing protein n=1 Tax=Fomitiporia mediterranea (strain MF3/22) TaxID=694068 RepID=UPI00044099E6|nr:histone-fold-containing protein [Fomitiporia mediterranea MF3/22]EJD00740.1 histone-fold-containing protein [Fomitiporia mediterranea MF3/22]
MPEQSTQPPFVQPGDLLPDFLRAFWQRQVDTAEQETPDFRHPPLPLARIKKVMKSDPEVKMIAADVFISEITARAFIVADANKRRTLSRSDIAKALAKSDQFDFLIDIVPREEGFPGAKRAATGTSSAAAATTTPQQHAGGQGSTGNMGLNVNAGGQVKQPGPGPSGTVIKRDEIYFGQDHIIPS